MVRPPIFKKIIITRYPRRDILGQEFLWGSIESNRPRNVALILRTEPNTIVNKMIEYAASQNFEQVLMMLLARSPEVNRDLALQRGAVKSGSLSLVQRLWEAGWQFGAIAAGTAGDVGNLEILKFVAQIDPIVLLDAVGPAAKNGHIHILEWLYEQDKLLFQQDGNFGRYGACSVPVIAWLVERQVLRTPPSGTLNPC